MIVKKVIWEVVMHNPNDDEEGIPLPIEMQEKFRTRLLNLGSTQEKIKRKGDGASDDLLTALRMQEGGLNSFVSR